MTRFSLSLVLGLSILATSCGGAAPPSLPRQLCGADAGWAVCPEGQSCRQGACWAPCKVDADYAADQYCDPTHFCAATAPTR